MEFTSGSGESCSLPVHDGIPSVNTGLLWSNAAPDGPILPVFRWFIRLKSGCQAWRGMLWRFFGQFSWRDVTRFLGANLLHAVRSARLRPSAGHRLPSVAVPLRPGARGSAAPNRERVAPLSGAANTDVQVFPLLERFSRVSSDSAHEVPAEIGRSASSNRKELLRDTIDKPTSEISQQSG